MKLKHILPVAIVAMVLFIGSCKKKDNPLPPPVPVLNPTITSFAPLHAKGGDTIIITGTDFSTTLATNIVKINGKAASVITATATSLSVKVPSLSGSGNLTVAIDAKSATSAAKFGYDTVWTVGTLAGNGFGTQDGSFATAQFSEPVTISMSEEGKLYVSEAGSQYGSIRILDTTTKRVTTLPNAFVTSLGISFSGDSIIYISSYADHSIYKLTSAGLTTFVGTLGQQGYLDNIGSDARFRRPEGIVTDKFGNSFVVDSRNKAIRKISKAGVVTTLVGGPTSPPFMNPDGITIDNKGHLFVTDSYTSIIYKIDTVSRQVTAFAGSSTSGNQDGFGSNAKFSRPLGIGIDTDGNLFVQDLDNKNIRKIDALGNVTTIATGLPVDIEGLTVDKNGVIYLPDATNNKIIMVAPK